MTVVEQNWAGKYCSRRTGVAVSGIWGVVRPDFVTIQKPTNPWITASASAVVAGSGTVTINCGADHATNYTVGIDRLGTGRVVTQELSGPTYTTSFNQGGIYRIYVTCYNSAGYADTSAVFVTVYHDLGTDFTAPILNKGHWKPIGNAYNSGYKVQLATETGFANQLWYFERQSDGSYKISSCYDGRCLDVKDASNQPDATVQTHPSNDNAAQRWYIWEEAGGYVLKPKCSDCVLDLTDNESADGTNIITYTYHGGAPQIWSIYRGEECILKSPSMTVSPGDSKSATTFTWGNVYGARNYNVKIWKGTAWDGEQFAGANNVTSGYSVVLPAGTYQAYVDAVHQFGCKMSNLVTFTVKEHTHSNTYKVTKSPTTSATGTLTGTCSKCSGTTTVTLPKLNTNDYSYTVTKAATCTAAGTGRYTWKTTTYGSFYFDVSIAAKGHSYTTKVTAPTCTAQGYTTYTCACGHSYKDNYTSATGHSYSYKVTKSPTTSATGTLTGTCSKCSGTTTVTLPKLNTSDYSYAVTKAATCTATGTGRYTWKTTTYGSFYFDVTIAATNHSYSYEATKAPTTSATGTLTGTCSKCSGTTTVTLPKLNSSDYSIEVLREPTCTEEGAGRYTWKNTSYGNFYFDSAIAATGHSFLSLLIVGCEEQGYTEHICTVCQYSYRDQYTDPVGHDLMQTGYQEPTCTEPGNVTYFCKNCRKAFITELPPQHTYLTLSWPATCTTGGFTSHTCRNCGYNYKDHYTDPLGHSYEDGICIRCSEPEIVISVVASGSCGENIDWALYDDGTLQITGSGAMLDYKSGQAPWYSLSETIVSVIIDDGITSVGSAAFMNCSNVTAVNLPYTLESIGEMAFYNCSFTEIELPQSLTFLGEDAFLQCSALLSVSIPDGITVLSDAFANCSSLTNVTLPETLTALEAGAFAGCSSLQSINLPRSLQSIGSRAFMDCVGLKTIRIPEGITKIEQDVFSHCSALTDVALPSTLQTICEQAFRNCYAITSIQIPAGVTRIEKNAFNGCSNLVQVELPEGLTDLGNYAFYDCGSLEEITLPEGLSQLRQYTFGRCYNLKHVDIPNTLIQIDQHVFDDCQKLEHIQIAEDNPAFCNDADGVVYSADRTRLIRATNRLSGEYRITELTTQIDPYAFVGIENLTHITLPNSITSISPWCFSHCENLNGIEIPRSVTSIGQHAFEYCGALEEIVLPASLAEIGEYAFRDNASLSAIYFLGNAPILGTRAFYNVTATVYYPADNETWTEEYRQKYNGGKITWESYDISTEIASGTSGSLMWKLTDNGVLTFSGTGKMKNYSYKTEMPWYKYYDRITRIVLEEGVTSIGDYAFYAMPRLESIEIASTVVTIGDYAFKNAPKLNNVILPEKLSSLGDSSFYACTGLTSIEIPAKLYTIKPYTFKNCVNLISVTFGEGNLQKISDGAFYGTGLTELILPDCLDILDVYAFKNCTSLTSIELGSGLTELREAVFYGTAIPSITIPEGITKIGPYAFKNCVKLQTIDLPESLTSVGEASFYACTGLKEIILPDAVKTIGNYAFRKCAAIEELSFGEELETIGECAFYGCTGLTELVIPDKVTTIKPYAFKTCTGLISVTLGNKVSTIGEGAFNTCTGLKTIVFPASLVSIGDYCFSGSMDLWKLTFQGDAPNIGTGAFKGLNAYAYYPGSNTTWNSSNMLNYGGKLTWKPL